MILLCAIIAVFIVMFRVFLNYDVGKCKCPKVDMTEKVVIVTGANSGIGFHTAKELSLRGARVILACRNEKKATEAREKLAKLTGNENIIYKQLDLTSLHSVKKFCKDIMQTEKRLDVLINNAGVFGCGHQYTEDGIVEGMQTNHFGPFLLTNLLLPLLKQSQPSRIVNVSSLIHYIGGVNIECLNIKGYYSDWLTYANGKYCNIVFTMELADRLRGTGVSVNACHPGVVRTGFMEDHALSTLAFKLLTLVCGREADAGAQALVHVATSKDCERSSGMFFVDCSRWPAAWSCNSASVRKNLWTISEKLLRCEQEDVNYLPAE